MTGTQMYLTLILLVFGSFSAGLFWAQMNSRGDKD
jgi:hypothetical protein